MKVVFKHSRIIAVLSTSFHKQKINDNYDRKNYIIVVEQRFHNMCSVTWSAMLIDVTEYVIGTSASSAVDRRQCGRSTK